MQAVELQRLKDAREILAAQDDVAYLYRNGTQSHCAVSALGAAAGGADGAYCTAASKRAPEARKALEEEALKLGAGTPGVGNAATQLSDRRGKAAVLDLYDRVIQAASV